LIVFQDAGPCDERLNRSDRRVWRKALPWEDITEKSSPVPSARLVVWSQQVDATPSNINLLSKGGVYDPRETGGAFCDAEDRHVVPLEGGTLVA
jgi:hypothetical protein